MCRFRILAVEDEFSGELVKHFHDWGLLPESAEVASSFPPLTGAEAVRHWAANRKRDGDLIDLVLAGADALDVYTQALRDKQAFDIVLLDVDLSYLETCRWKQKFGGIDLYKEMARANRPHAEPLQPLFVLYTRSPEVLSTGVQLFVLGPGHDDRDYDLFRPTIVEYNVRATTGNQRDVLHSMLRRFTADRSRHRVCREPGVLSRAKEKLMALTNTDTFSWDLWEDLKRESIGPWSFRTLFPLDCGAIDGLSIDPERARDAATGLRRLLPSYRRRLAELVDEFDRKPRGATSPFRHFRSVVDEIPITACEELAKLLEPFADLGQENERLKRDLLGPLVLAAHSADTVAAIKLIDGRDAHTGKLRLEILEFPAKGKAFWDRTGLGGAGKSTWVMWDADFKTIDTAIRSNIDPGGALDIKAEFKLVCRP